jgi:hypothetical protein
VFCREILHNGQWNIRSYSITRHLYISQITVGKFLHTILLALTVAKNIPLAYVYRRTCECHSYKMGNNWQYWQLYFAYAIMINVSLPIVKNLSTKHRIRVTYIFCRCIHIPLSLHMLCTKAGVRICQLRNLILSLFNFQTYRKVYS